MFCLDGFRIEGGLSYSSSNQATGLRPRRFMETEDLPDLTERMYSFIELSRCVLWRKSSCFHRKGGSLERPCQRYVNRKWRSECSRLPSSTRLRNPVSRSRDPTKHRQTRFPDDSKRYGCGDNSRRGPTKRGWRGNDEKKQNAPFVQ